MMRLDPEAKVILTECPHRASVITHAQRINGVCDGGNQKRSLTVHIGSRKQSPRRRIKADELFIKASWSAIAERKNGWEALLDQLDLLRRHGTLRALCRNYNGGVCRKYRVQKEI